MSEHVDREEPPRRSMYIEKAAAYLVNADQHELGNAVAVEVNWSEWAVARIAQLEHEKAAAGRANGILLKDVDRLIGEKQDLRERAKELEGDVGRLTEHSVMLNSVGWKVAQALEVVPPGSRMMELDVPRLVVQLIGQRDMLRDAAQDSSKHLRDLMVDVRNLREREHDLLEQAGMARGIYQGAEVEHRATEARLAKAPEILRHLMGAYVDAPVFAGLIEQFTEALNHKREEES